MFEVSSQDKAGLEAHLVEGASLVLTQFLAQNFVWFSFVAVTTSKTNDRCRGVGEILRCTILL